MASIDLTPLYRTSVGFDHLGSLLNAALRPDMSAPSYPPYDIELIGENQYAIKLAVAGFSESDLTIETETGCLTIKGEHASRASDRELLYQGIASRGFERKFSLADHVEVKEASLVNGLLIISLEKRIPDEMKPKHIAIQSTQPSLEHQTKQTKKAA